MKDSTKQILNLTQLSFHQIRKNEITQVSGFWGRGTRILGTGHTEDPKFPVRACHQTPATMRGKDRDTF